MKKHEPCFPKLAAMMEHQMHLLSALSLRFWHLKLVEESRILDSLATVSEGVMRELDPTRQLSTDDDAPVSVPIDHH